MLWDSEFMRPTVICFNDGNSAEAAETKKRFMKLQLTHWESISTNAHKMDHIIITANRYRIQASYRETFV